MMMGTITNKATELLATDASLLGDAVLDGLTVIEGTAIGGRVRSSFRRAPPCAPMPAPHHIPRTARPRSLDTPHG